MARARDAGRARGAPQTDTGAIGVMLTVEARYDEMHTRTACGAKRSYKARSAPSISPILGEDSATERLHSVKKTQPLLLAFIMSISFSTLIKPCSIQVHVRWPRAAPPSHHACRMHPLDHVPKPQRRSRPPTRTSGLVKPCSYLRRKRSKDVLERMCQKGCAGKHKSSSSDHKQTHPGVEALCDRLPERVGDRDGAMMMTSWTAPASRR